MKKILYLLAISVVLTPVSVFALVTGNAYTDIIGNVNYTFSDGTSGYSYKDSAGYTHYQFSNGLYGNAYTDITGNTHYYFDETNKTIYINGTCIYPRAGSCIEESQYQEMYNNALQGLPSCSQSSGEAGSFSVPAEACTAEGREKLIMNGTYGPWLKTCRESINSYASSKAYYDKCVQEQDKRYEQLAQMKLDLLKKQLDNERQRLELEKLKAEANKQTAPVKSSPVSNDTNSCSSGSVWNGKACVTCAVYMPHSSPQIYGSVTACSCNDGFHYDLSSQSCLTAAEWIKTEQKPTTPFQAVGVDLERKKVEAELKLEADKKAAESKTIKVIPKNSPSIKKIEKITPVITTNTEAVTIKQPITPVTEQKIEEVKKSIDNPPTKIGVFQKVGEKADSAAHGVSSFFKKMFTKVKFW